MTATVEGTTLQIGDRVQIADPAYCRTWSRHDEPNDYVAPEFHGKTGVIVAAGLYGNFEVRRDDGSEWSTNLIAPEFLTKIVDEPAKAERQELHDTGFAVGDRVRYTGRTYPGDEELVGKVGTVVEIDSPANVWVQYDADQALPEWLTADADRKGGHFPGNLELIVEEASQEPQESHEVAELRRELERVKADRDNLRTHVDAERKALVDYKAFVRSKVIEESEAQGWCSRTDSWLTKLGLKDRFGDLPKGKGAVLLLKGNRIAVLKRPQIAAEAFDVRGIGSDVMGVVGGYIAAWEVEPDLLEVLSEGRGTEES